jgi:hypothetical protein
VTAAGLSAHKRAVWKPSTRTPPNDVAHLNERTGRGPDFIGFFDRGPTSIRLAGSVLLEELDKANKPTGRWELLLKDEFNDRFVHTDDLADFLAVQEAL